MEKSIICNEANLACFTLAIGCVLQLGCKKQESTENRPNSPLSTAQVEQLVAELYEAGAEARPGSDGIWSLSVDRTPEKCLPLSNRIPAIDTFFVGGSALELTVDQLDLLKVRNETTEFRILYGSLAPDVFALLPKKFPELKELILWSHTDSDISRLGEFPNLAEFTSDYDNLITVEEAERIRLQKSLIKVRIDRAESREVFDILRQLPQIQELSVTVFREDGEEVEYRL